MRQSDKDRGAWEQINTSAPFKHSERKVDPLQRWERMGGGEGRDPLEGKRQIPPVRNSAFIWPTQCKMNPNACPSLGIKGLWEGDPVCAQLIPFKCAFSKNKAAITSTMLFCTIRAFSHDAAQSSKPARRRRSFKTEDY